MPRFSPRGVSIRPVARLPSIQFRFKGLSSFDQRIFTRNWRNINLSPLEKAGLVVRRGFRDLIRPAGKKRKPSKPGKPPKSQDPRHLFRRVHSVVDRFRTQAVIGHQNLFGANQTAMQMHEFGEVVKIKVPSRQRRKAFTKKQAAAARRLFLKGRIKSAPIPKVVKSIKMPERRFALPALMRARIRVPKMWKNSVNKKTVTEQSNILSFGSVQKS